MKTSINCLYKEEKVVVAKIANTTDKEKQNEEHDWRKAWRVGYRPSTFSK